MDSDLSDIQKIQNVLGNPIRDNDSPVVEYNMRCKYFSFSQDVVE